MKDLDPEYCEMRADNGEVYIGEKINLNAFIQHMTMGQKDSKYNSDLRKLLNIEDLFVIKHEENGTPYENKKLWQLDLINFKLFALLMCPGEPKEKADYMFNMLLGYHHLETTEQANTCNSLVTWKEPRVRVAIYKLIYFAEIFPKQYYKHFLDKLP